MDAISLMMEEHKNIKRVLKVVRTLCIRLMNGDEVNFDVFYKVIDFIRNYADSHHHNKEEEILFKKMTDELGHKVGEGPIFGMLSEHDLGRLFIKNLEDALNRVKEGDKDSKVDVIANAIAYTDLLHRHIEKEDNAVYKFGRSQLSKEAMKEVQERCEEVEKAASNEKLQEKYIKLIQELEHIAQ